MGQLLRYLISSKDYPKTTRLIDNKNMDFLDPRKRRSNQIRLIIGYFLMWVAIILGTVILVYAAYGYGINTKTGEVVENGLLFVGSKPSGGEIYLNGKDQNATTASRLVLPAGNYTLSIKRSGYRDWQRSFGLDEHSIARYVYPFLFPTKPRVTPLKTYSTQSPLVTQSPDRRWYLVQNPDAAAGAVSFDEYDTTATDMSKNIQAVNIPSGILSGDQSGSSLSLIEWSTDNNHVLLKNTYAGGDEFIVFDRANPADSFNVNKLFGIAPNQVALFNKKVDQLYIYDQSQQTLQLGDVSKATLATPLIKDALAFKPYGTNLIAYITTKNQSAGQAQARIWSNGQTYPLYSFTAGDHYLIDMAQYQGQWYYFAGSNKSPRINIYKNPLDNIKNPAIGKAVPVLALQDPGATEGSFSANTEFIEVESGQSFAVYDLETLNSYQYTLSSPLAAPMSWMDGDRLVGSTGGNVLVMDYDDTNAQTLVPTLQPEGGLFSRDYNHLLVMEPVSGSDGASLVNVDLRAGVDLPKQ